MRRLTWLPILLVAITPLRSHAASGPFDLVFVDNFDVTLCSGCGITLAGLDYALLVNTGTTDITLDDLRAAQFSVVSSQPEISLHAFINIPNEEIVGAIHPGEAMGSVMTGNELLLDPLKPGETLRNLPEMQFMAFQIERLVGSSYEGPVTFDIHMSMRDYELDYRLNAEVHEGDHAIMFLTATRAVRKSALLAATPARSSTWGELKRRYR